MHPRRASRGCGIGFAGPQAQRPLGSKGREATSVEAYATRQILSMLVPPGAPIGSPQVMA